MRRLWIGCVLLAGCESSGGACHEERVVENPVWSRAEIDGAAVRDFNGRRFRDQDDVEQALRGLIATRRAMWGWIDRNGTIHAFAGTRGGGQVSTTTGDLVADMLSDFKVAASPDPEHCCHRAAFELEVVPEIAIKVALQGDGGALLGVREHRITVAIDVAAGASTDGCPARSAHPSAEPGWGASPTSAIAIAGTWLVRRRAALSHS